MPAPTPPTDGILTAAYLGALAAYVDKIREMAAGLFARKTLDEPINNVAALQDDDELFVVLSASSTYRFELHLPYNSNATADFQYGFSGPSGYTMQWSHLGLDTGGAFTATSGFTQVNAPSVGGTGANVAVHAWGVIVTDTSSGTFRVRWSQAVANVSDTIVRAGATLTVYRVA